MGKYYEDQFCMDDYFSNGNSNAESRSGRGSQNSRTNSQSESASGRGRSGSNSANSGSSASNASANSNSGSNSDTSGRGGRDGKGGKDGKDGKEGKGKDGKGRPRPPYFNSEYARLVNSATEQTSISDGAPLVFSEITDNNGDFIKFKPNTGSIILEENGIYLAIYESQVYSTEPTACNHSLGLYLDLDGNPIRGSGTVARVGANQKAELVSHAIITTSEGCPNILQLLNQSDKNINSFGANLTLLKIGEIRER